MPSPVPCSGTTLGNRGGGANWRHVPPPATHARVVRSGPNSVPTQHSPNYFCLAGSSSPSPPIAHSPSQPRSGHTQSIYTAHALLHLFRQLARDVPHAMPLSSRCPLPPPPPPLVWHHESQWYVLLSLSHSGSVPMQPSKSFRTRHLGPCIHSDGPTLLGHHLLTLYTSCLSEPHTHCRAGAAVQSPIPHASLCVTPHSRVRPVNPVALLHTHHAPRNAA